MFFAKVFYTGDGSTKTFSVPFEYIAQAHVKVTLAGSEVSTYTWPTDSTIEFDTAPGNGVEIGFIRETPRDERLVDFQDASNLTEEILDLDSRQVFFLAQEYLDQYTSSIVLDDSGNWDAQGNRLTNVDAPVNLDDAATKRWVLNNLPSADSIVTNTSNPTTGDDANAGYAVGARWLNTTSLRMFTLVDDTVANAVWTPVAGVHVDTSAPTVDDDGDSGYVEGDQWVRTDTNETWVLMDATTGAAVWSKLANDSELAAAESDISTLQSEMNAAQSNISTLQTDVGNNSSDINSLDGRMTTAEGNITNNDSDISALQTATQDANLLAAIKNVDGPGSGLDADLLDGKNLSSTPALTSNLLINGCTRVMQRDSSTAARSLTTSWQFLKHDRWEFATGAASAGTVDWIYTDSATSDRAVLLTGGSGVTYMFMRQRIEGKNSAVLTFTGKATLKYRFHNNTGGDVNLTATLYYADSVDNFASRTLITSRVDHDTVGGGWSDVEVELDLGADATYANNGLELQLRFDNLDSSAKSVRITDIQLVPGDTAGDFVLPDFGLELLRCQRYYEKSCNYDDLPTTGGYLSGYLSQRASGGGAGGVEGPYRLMVRKRATPTLTLYAGQSGNPGKVTASSADWPSGGTAVGTAAGETGFGYVTRSGGSDTLDDKEWIYFHYEAEAEL